MKSFLTLILISCLSFSIGIAQTVKIYTTSGIFKSTHTTVAAALAAAVNDDSIVLSAHTFKESNLKNAFLSSAILQGTISGKDTSTIDASGNGVVLNFTGTIRDIVLTGGGPDAFSAGGALGGSGKLAGYTTIRNNISSNNRIVFFKSGVICDNVKIINNTILDASGSNLSGIVELSGTNPPTLIKDNVIISGNKGGKSGAIFISGAGDRGDTNVIKNKYAVSIEGNVRIENNEGTRAGAIWLCNYPSYITISGATIVHNRCTGTDKGAAITIDSQVVTTAGVPYDTVSVNNLKLSKCRIYNPKADGTRQTEIRIYSRIPFSGAPKGNIITNDGCWWGENDTTGLIKKDPGTIIMMPNWSVSSWFCSPSSSTVTNVMAQMKLNTGAALPTSSLKTIEGKYSATAGSFSASTVPINSSNVVNSVFTYPTSGTFAVTASIDADTFRPTNKELHIVETGFETVKIYPNPASDILHISGIEKGSVIALYDMGGRMLLHQIATGTVEQLTLAPLAAGTYLMELIAPSGSKGHVTLMKE